MSEQLWAMLDLLDSTDRGSRISTGFLLGINAALRHPEWAQAVHAAYLRDDKGISSQANAMTADKIVSKFPFEALA